MSSVRQFLADFPTPDPAEIQTRVPTGAFSSVYLWGCAYLLRREPRFSPLEHFKSHAPSMTNRGGSASRAMRSRIAANKFRVTATSASWKNTDLACRVTFAPILMSFSRSVVSDQCRTGFGRASRRRKFPSFSLLTERGGVSPLLTLSTSNHAPSGDSRPPLRELNLEWRFPTREPSSSRAGDGPSRTPQGVGMVGSGSRRGRGG